MKNNGHNPGELEETRLTPGDFEAVRLTPEKLAELENGPREAIREYREERRRIEERAYAEQLRALDEEKEHKHKCELLGLKAKALEHTIEYYPDQLDPEIDRYIKAWDDLTEEIKREAYAARCAYSRYSDLRRECEQLGRMSQLRHLFK